MVHTRHARPRISIRSGHKSLAQGPSVPGPVAAAQLQAETPVVPAPKAPEPAPGTVAAAQVRAIASNHPVVTHSIGRMRNLNTRRIEYRASAVRAATTLLVEATRDLPMQVSEAGGAAVIAKPTVVLALGSDGLVLSREASAILPGVHTGNFGQGTSHEGVTDVRLHLVQAPALANATVILIDPVIRASSLTRSALNFLRQNGVSSPLLVGLVASRKSIEQLQALHPGVQILVGAVDNDADEKGRPSPGVGDFPSRFHGE